MDTALAPVNPAALAAMPSGADGFAQRLVALPAGRKLMLGFGLVALIGIAMAMSNWSSNANYKVLFAGLSDKDGGAILAQLSQMNVPYKHADGGAAILVPADKVHDVRLKLASQGLPKGSVAGFELMDNARFGQTQFQERLTFQRGLEGELTRSISALAAVQSARVHLALPNQNGFFREQQKPSASVLLTLHAGRTLDRAQIAGIVHLVSSSVPELNPKAVSVLDASGALLSGNGGESNPAGGLDAQQLQYRQQIEQNYTQRVLDILEPVLGRDNLRAQVTAEIDFAQTESTSEEYAPNQGALANGKPASTTIRSQQTSESSGSSGGAAGGVPGAASNQPPTPATAPINGQAAPLQGAQANGGGGNGNSNSRREATTNYEVDKTVRVTRNATGTVKRLNAAVVLNHRSNVDAKGKTTSAPLSAEEIDKLTALVKETVGFNAERGDSVKLINAPFKTEKPAAEVSVPLWKQPEVMDTLRSLAAPLGLALLALIVVFGAVRPALKAVQPAPGARKLDAVVDDAQLLPAAAAQQPLALEAPQADQRLDKARVLAKENPAAMAGIVRGWASKEV
ncbi:MAG TPA: flagellar basal-body MS-ring/collar protein FliF [Methylibium sp.]|uniref:flagellar basal-body MS-ring/collar protein FliF n=1 Tax=Methylibium sp. TaxID=2067992 RepID=UPI002DB598D8|nr:flagellar basal-body MS-ring/collar protein FliF [Methylibium sp.]HEU4458615.1 flagellar basal-body MS-ring/collar protein FliF [Methylibium sp.]